MQQDQMRIPSWLSRIFRKEPAVFDRIDNNPEEKP